ncbi:MAG: chemotaxis protein CheB, partial [Pseudomonadota bacterium]
MADEDLPSRTAPPESPARPEARPSHVVGIGASAGGLEALERFFSGLGDSTGMAFVVIQHLSPDFTSMMPQILKRTTTMPIKPVESGTMAVDPNTIYLIVPGKEMIISHNRLLTTDRSEELNLPIDLFFKSLADDQGARGVGIVLSGTGSDGANGVVEIHRAGGLTISQTLRSAEFDGMPKSAVRTGVIDLVLDPEHMPAALTGHAKRLPMQFSRDSDTSPGLFDEVFELLRERFDVDFGYYKPNTIVRRVERRMMVRHRASLQDYLKLLRADSEELETLYHDLLIGVTKFFRDPEVWRYLRDEVIPDFVKRAPSEIRVWSCGCATGEEPYSLAILFQEAFEAGDPEKFPDIKIFATDVHQ